jgi:hypothetical protein
LSGHTEIRHLQKKNSIYNTKYVILAQFFPTQPITVHSEWIII